MKFLFKLICLFIAAFVLVTVLAGCSSDELTLFNAMLNSESIKTMESKTEISMKMEASGLSESDQEKLEMVLPLLNSSRLVIDQKLSRNEDKTVAKSQISADISLGGISMNTEIWVDYDITGSEPKLKEIIKLPLIASMGMPEEYKGKEYMVLDLTQRPEMEGSSMASLKQMLDMNRILTKEFTEFLKKYAAQLKPGFEVVKLKERKTVSGKPLQVYELKLDDQTFKALLKHAVNNFIEDKDALSLIEKYLTSMASMPGFTAEGREDSQAELEETLADLNAGMPKFKEQFNKIMDALDDVKIIGDKGVTIRYTIDSQGYIVGETGTLDIEINKPAIEQAVKSLDPDSYDVADSVSSNEVYKFTFDFTTTISNINKAVDIQLPELNDENSFNMLDMSEAAEPAYEQGE